MKQIYENALFDALSSFRQTHSIPGVMIEHYFGTDKPEKYTLTSQYEVYQNLTSAAFAICYDMITDIEKDYESEGENQ